MEEPKNRKDLNVEHVEILSEEVQVDETFESSQTSERPLPPLQQGLFSRFVALFIAFCCAISAAIYAAVGMVSLALSILTFSLGDPQRRLHHYKQWLKVKNLIVFTLAGLIAVFSLKVAILFVSAYLASEGSEEMMSGQMKTFFHVQK